MKKFTFRKQPRETGLRSVGHPHPSTEIKYGGREVGLIQAPYFGTPDHKWGVGLMVKEAASENCPWGWIFSRRGSTPNRRRENGYWPNRPRCWQNIICGMMMTPDEIRQARKALGLSTNGLAEALRLGKGGGRTVRRWEAGETPISGPASVAVQLLLERQK
jgi:hypothetical protein